MSAEAPPHAEVVIVRRGHGGDHDGHHGGVWKIAYADFMTAMMAFFLVMWLINAANEETRSQVASYFNPVKLTDSVTSDKGLNQPKNKPKKSKADSPAETKHEDKEEKDFEEAKGESEKQRASEEKLFKDPYVVLAQLGGEAAQGSPAGESETGAATEAGGHSGLRDGEAYRDPFDPQAWQALPQPMPEKDEAKQTETAAVEPKPAAPPRTVMEIREDRELPQRKLEPLTPGPKKPDQEITTNDSAKTKKPELDQAEAAGLLRDIKESLGQYGEGNKPGIAVEATKDGLLISLTDTIDFGMFSIGSAEPKPKVVAIMEKIAGILKGRPGEIVLRGHTDARPYRSDLYDNWRLSSARAQMAYYMLTRAGVAPERVARIEGHAERMLKRPDKPFDAENRRIEILLRAGDS
jgi:chemotaxis protein MotB